MKVGIITFHFAHNSGAVLQCWALQQKLIEMEFEPEVIDYQPNYHKGRYAIIRNPFLFVHNNWLISTEKTPKKFITSLSIFIKTILGNRKFSSRKKQQYKFRDFLINYLHLSPEMLSMNDSIPLNYDAIICGSDQIWNINLTKGSFDTHYFAKTQGFKGIKIAYAASVGELNISKHAHELTILLHDFINISTREEKSALQLSNILHRTVATVPDPTVLIDRNQYNKFIESKSPEKPYILVYSLENSSLLKNTIEFVASKMQLDVIDMSPIAVKLDTNHIHVSDIGPKDFLSYIYHARYVITNSFHGTVFSHILEKPISVVSHTTRNTRIADFLSACGTLGTLIYSDENIADSFSNIINYKEVSSKLNIYRQTGEQFLTNSLKSKQNRSDFI